MAPSENKSYSLGESIKRKMRMVRNEVERKTGHTQQRTVRNWDFIQGPWQENGTIVFIFLKGLSRSRVESGLAGAESR